MKKIMTTIIGALLISATASAANFNWYVEYLISPVVDPYYAEGASLYLMCDDLGTSFDSTTATVSSYLATGTADNEGYLFMAVNGVAATPELDYDFYFVALYKDANSTYYYVSDELTVTAIGAGNAPVSFPDCEDEVGMTAASWTKVENVPEPTSGLLLLMGMGALALRRKQK